ncbi:MAG: hypothetical protein E7324_02305 [Clostridiales bacterium]|nr:hypothetical protein [Clostridiales bacterium]
MRDHQLLRAYFEEFAAQDQELYINLVDNAHAADFMAERVPRFSCADKALEKCWYFRWWTYRKHIKKTDGGYVITEFLPPVPWAGTDNCIPLAAGQHILEGRWLKDEQILSDYAAFWFERCRKMRYYTSSIPYAIGQACLVQGKDDLGLRLLDGMDQDYRTREKGVTEAGVFMSLRDEGLFFTSDNMDGGEISVGGDGMRPFANAMMYGNARAIARFAEADGNTDLQAAYTERADKLQQMLKEKLWQEEDGFFEVLRDGGKLSRVRELYGYAPWFTGMDVEEFGDCWKHVMEEDGFLAPFGLTFCEQRHPGFSLAYEGHECQWNGPVWPLSSSIVMTGMINAIRQGAPVTRADFGELMKRYVKCHSLTENGVTKMWIDENLHPYTGDWMARTMLRDRKQPPLERGKDYNHSTFADLVITGVAGLQPAADDIVRIDPICTAQWLPYFALEGVAYHGASLDIIWDQTGDVYGRGHGLSLYIDGRLAACRADLGYLEASITKA